MSLLDLLPPSEDNNKDDTSTLEDTDFATLWPNVWTLCTMPVGPDGKKRELSTLLFFVEGAVWKARLSERNHHLDLWSGGKTFNDAVEGLESSLRQRPVPWRKQQLPRAGGKR